MKMLFFDPTHLRQVQSDVRAALSAAAKNQEDEDTARARVSALLAGSPFAQEFATRFRREFYFTAEATMTTAFTAVNEDILAEAEAPELAVGEEGVAKAARYVAAATAFTIIDDQELDEPIATILGIYYQAGKWPGPRCAPSYATGPR